MENRNKALKAAEKQAALLSKRKEGENKAEEERLLKQGCPIAKAEKAFFDSLNRTRKERESKSSVEDPSLTDL